MLSSAHDSACRLSSLASTATTTFSAVAAFLAVLSPPPWRARLYVRVCDRGTGLILWLATALLYKKNRRSIARVCTLYAHRTGRIVILASRASPALSCAAVPGGRAARDRDERRPRRPFLLSSDVSQLVLALQPLVFHARTQGSQSRHLALVRAPPPQPQCAAPLFVSWNSHCWLLPRRAVTFA